MNTVRLRLCLLVPVSKARSRQKLQQINAAVPKGTISPYFAMQPKSIDAETVDGVMDHFSSGIARVPLKVTGVWKMCKTGPMMSFSQARRR